jgi:hypothetical protein
MFRRVLGEDIRANREQMLLPYEAGTWGPDAVKKLRKWNPEAP